MWQLRHCFDVVSDIVMWFVGKNTGRLNICSFTTDFLFCFHYWDARTTHYLWRVFMPSKAINHFLRSSTNHTHVRVPTSQSSTAKRCCLPQLRTFSSATLSLTSSQTQRQSSATLPSLPRHPTELQIYPLPSKFPTSAFARPPFSQNHSKFPFRQQCAELSKLVAGSCCRRSWLAFKQLGIRCRTYSCILYFEITE